MHALPKPHRLGACGASIRPNESPSPVAYDATINVLIAYDVYHRNLAYIIMQANLNYEKVLLLKPLVFFA